MDPGPRCLSCVQLSWSLTDVLKTRSFPSLISNTKRLNLQGVFFYLFFYTVTIIIIFYVVPSIRYFEKYRVDVRSEFLFSGYFQPLFAESFLRPIFYKTFRRKSRWTMKTMLNPCAIHLFSKYNSRKTICYTMLRVNHRSIVKLVIETICCSSYYIRKICFVVWLLKVH